MDGTQVPTNLPLSLDSFVGRDEQIVEVAKLAAGARLVTLTGPPGIGKTRLALEVLRVLGRGEDYPDGVWLVDLAPVADPTLVWAAVASALGVREQRGLPVPDTVVTRLREQRLLVVLDNCEHLVETSAQLAEQLLRSCRDVSILVTSQEPLAVAGEIVWRVPPLSVPEAGASTLDQASRAEAVRLFCQRAAVLQPGFELTAEVAPAVSEICRRLDGIPLAIELAVARIDVLSSTELAARLSDRFGLLTGGRRAALPRQQTLRAALDWSHELLTEPERVLLRRLSVFAGGFTLGAAEQVVTGKQVAADKVFDLLSRLVAKSLVVSEPWGPQTRYRLLETVRVYARDRLVDSGEVVALRSRHADWCVRLAEEAEPRLSGHQQQSWLERLETEHDNLRAALEWSLAEGRNELALRLAGALTLFWRIRGHFTEGRDRLAAVVSAGDSDEVLVRAKALWGLGFLTAMLGAYADAVPIVEEALALHAEAGDTQGQARSLLLLGNCSLFIEGRSTGLGLLEEAVALARKAGDSWCLALALALSGTAHSIHGDVAEARPLLEESLAVAREAGDNQGLAFALSALGYVSMCQGDYVVADELLTQALTAARVVGETYDIANALTDLGHLAAVRGDHERATRLLEEALARAQETGAADAIVYPMDALGELALARGELDAARQWFEKALALADAAGGSVDPAIQGLGEVALAEGDLAGARARLEEALALARRDEHKARVARALHGLAKLARAEGDDGRAASMHHQALALRAEIKDAPGVVQSLEALAGLAASAGRLDRAARLFGAAAAVSARGGFVRAAPDTERYDADLAAVRKGPGQEVLGAAWAQGAALSLDDAVAYASKGRGARTRPTTGWDSLTPAERDVAVLVAQGLTNPQIAERLFVSRDTVKGHVARIFGKMGVSSRTELATEVLAHQR